jgi:phosphopentomutase
MPQGLGATEPIGQWGYGVETSLGKDTPSGHWEIAGAPVRFQWGYFPEKIPAFPASLTNALIVEGRLTGILGDKHASGTGVIEELGEEHLRTLMPICYTSADSVLQIAAHEEAFGLDRLYDLCRIARRLCDPLNIGRVIARPFIGARAGEFSRTHHRKDFAIPPPAGNIFERAADAGRDIVSIGKIGDIFAHSRTGREVKGASNEAHVDLTLEALASAADGGFIFVNLVDFDTEFGHRRDVPGYAACLEAFDRRLPEIMARMRHDDYCVITADHGNDPTWRGFDHTREHVPILGFGGGLAPAPIGRRKTLADIAQTLSSRLALAPGPDGESWL